MLTVQSVLEEKAEPIIVPWLETHCEYNSAKFLKVRTYSRFLRTDFQIFIFCKSMEMTSRSDKTVTLPLYLEFFKDDELVDLEQEHFDKRHNE